MDKSHSPAPWVALASEKYPYAIFPANEHGRPRSLSSIAWVTSWDNQFPDEANAQHLVHCVNLHDDLVEALQKISDGKISQEYLEDFCAPLLAKAKGGAA